MSVERDEEDISSSSLSLLPLVFSLSLCHPPLVLYFSPFSCLSTSSFLLLIPLFFHPVLLLLLPSCTYPSVPHSIYHLSSCTFFLPSLFPHLPSSAFLSSLSSTSSGLLSSLFTLLRLFFIPRSLISCTLSDVATEATIMLLSINTPSSLSLSNRGSFSYCSDPFLSIH